MEHETSTQEIEPFQSIVHIRLNISEKLFLSMIRDSQKADLSKNLAFNIYQIIKLALSRESDFPLFSTAKPIFRNTRIERKEKKKSNLLLPLKECFI